MVNVTYVRQKEALGLGHAVLMSRDAVGAEPFAVMLGDDIIDGPAPCLGQMVSSVRKAAVFDHRNLRSTEEPDFILRRHQGNSGRRVWRTRLSRSGRRGETVAGEGAFESCHHRTVHPDAGNLWRARKHGARRGRRNPAHRRHPATAGATTGLRLHDRRHTL